jgi:hypothetical protein
MPHSWRVIVAAALPDKAVEIILHAGLTAGFCLVDRRLRHRLPGISGFSRPVSLPVMVQWFRVCSEEFI